MFYYLKNYLFLKADFEFAIPWITLPWGWPMVAPGYAAPPEELEYAREAGGHFLVVLKKELKDASQNAKL